MFKSNKIPNMVNVAFTGVIRNVLEYRHMIPPFLSFIAVALRNDSPMEHKSVFSKIWSFPRSNSYFFLSSVERSALLWISLPLKKSGLQRWRYFSESTFSLRSFQAFLLSFKRLSGQLFPLSDLSFPISPPYDMALSTVLFSYILFLLHCVCDIFAQIIALDTSAQLLLQLLLERNET